MIVYGSSLAPAVRKVLAFLGEKGLAAGQRSLAPHDPLPEFTAASPFGQIPAFRDGAFTLSDSTAICHYLELKYPDPPLFPVRAEEYGRMIWFDQFADNLLGAAECKVVMNRVVKPLLRAAPEEGVAEKAIGEELPPLLDYLEGEITGPFLAGDALSLADLAVASPFASLRVACYSPDRARWPRLRSYVDRILARAAFARIEVETVVV